MARYRVVWRNTKDRFDSGGSGYCIIDRAAADKAAQTLNLRYPHIEHWVEEEPEPEGDDVPLAQRGFGT